MSVYKVNRQHFKVEPLFYLIYLQFILQSQTTRCQLLGWFINNILECMWNKEVYSLIWGITGISLQQTAKKNPWNLWCQLWWWPRFYFGTLCRNKPTSATFSDCVHYPPPPMEKTWRKCQSIFDFKMKDESSQIKTMIQPLSGMLYHINK
jgi:hypothetical protein